MALALLAAPARAAPSPAPVAQTPVPQARLSQAIQTSLLALKPSLGELAPWQKTIFTDELLAHGEDFLKEHRQLGDKVQVTLDEALIRKVLSFYAPKVLGNDQPRIAARIEAGERCKLCEDGVPVLKKLFQTRLDNRAMRPVWFKDEEMPSTPAQGTPEELATQLSRFGFLRALEISRGLQGALLVRVEPTTLIDQETGQVVEPLHPEDGKYVLRLGLTLGKFVVSKKAEFQPTESIETLGRRLFTEALSELTDRAPKLDTGPYLAKGPAEILLWVYGIRDYFVLTNLKAQVQLAVGELTPVLERSLSRSKLLLAIRTEKSSEEVRRALSAVTVGSQKLVLSAVSGYGKDPSVLEGELK
jgi:hypothetical protein